MSVCKRNLKAVFFSMLLVAVSLFSGVAAASAVVVIDGPFGEVPLGSTGTSAIQVNAPATSGTTLAAMSFSSGSSSQFSVMTTLPATGLYLSPGSSTLIEVVFTPSVTGPAGATLVINTLTTSGWTSVPGEIHLNLTGTGIDPQDGQADAAGDSQQVQGLLAFFDNAVATGRLEGKGKGKSARKRLKAVRKKIKSVEKKLNRGKRKKACGQIRAISKKIGSHVQGAAAGELSARLEQLAMDLGCK